MVTKNDNYLASNNWLMKTQLIIGSDVIIIPRLGVPVEIFDILDI